MRSFSKKPPSAQQTTCAKSSKPSSSFSGHTRQVRSILHPHCTRGNRVVQRLPWADSAGPEVEANAGTARFAGDLSQKPLHSGMPKRIQWKLKVNAPGDEYEQEADRVADQLLRDPEPGVHLSPISGEKLSHGSGGQSDHNQPAINRVRASGAPEAIVPSVVAEVASSPGCSLEAATQELMESRFGHDFSEVRVHTDVRAGESARALGARAYTVGPEIVFGAGEYAPGTAEGRRLLAHELVHVIQQEGPLSHSSAAWLQRQAADDITARVGPVSGQGGLIHDTSRKRMSIIVGPNDTLRTIARRLLPIWNNAQPFTPPEEATPRPVTQLTEEQLAKGLMVYNRYYLAVPLMTGWKVGLRFPLPIEVNRVTEERSLHPDLIVTWANTFDPAWVSLLDMPPAALTPPAQADLAASVQTFLQENETLTARGIHLSARAMRNALEAAPFIQEVFRQAASEAFDLALAFMDWIVIHQFDLLVSQTPGQEILDTIRNALASAPSSLTESQQRSLARANGLLNRMGVFSEATAEQFRDIYVTTVPGSNCMAAVYHGFEALFSERISRSIQDQVGRESREVMRRTGRNTNHMNRVMETVRARGMAGPETRLVHQRAADTWQPDPESTVLGMTRPGVAGWYFFGLSLHAAYHSVILAVDRTDPETPRIYWMDQFTKGFTRDVTGSLMNQMRRFKPSYGFAPSRMWQIIPAADTLIILD